MAATDMNGAGADHPATGLHVGIIMDGNGRWATQRGRPRVAGHREGAKAVRRVIQAAPDFGISTLTLFAFSSDNWKRPTAEVTALMRLFRQYLISEAKELAAKGARLTVIGRRDRLPAPVLDAMEACEAATRGGQRLLVRVAVDYSARDTIVQAAQRCALAALASSPGSSLQPLSRQQFTRLIAEAAWADSAPDLDLLIRTGGEQRLSDFLLWEAAYAELVFTSILWPDFDSSALAGAVAAFHRRERRFGGLPSVPPTEPVAVLEAEGT